MSTLPSLLIAQDTCLSDDAVLAFQRGETTESERQRIHGHMDTCDVCRQLLVATAAMDEGGSRPGVELDSMERLAAVIGSSLRMTTFTEGKRLAHRFDVTRFLDRGGMGEVYAAFDSVVGARVALKALLCTAADDDPGVSRLGEEVKLARRIAHPNVCRIYDLHEHRESEHLPLRFLAMEFVDGVTLKERLLAGELPLDEACSIARQLLLGLGAVHAAGVLHLDFKSQNVMLRHGKTPAQPVVMDFSLSRAFDNELRLRTSERRAAGSIGYMSPEQLECRSTIGPAADVYAFGVVFYEMLTGHMPFQGDSPAAIMLKQLKSRAAPPSRSRPAVSPGLDEFVLTCLSRQARSRFQSAANALEAFDGCLQPVSPEGRRTGVPWLQTLAVAGLAATLAGTLVHLAGRTTAAEASAAGGAVASVGPVLPLPSAPAEAGGTPARDVAAAPKPAPSAGALSSAGATPEPSSGGEQREPAVVAGAPTQSSPGARARADRGAALPPTRARPARRKRSVEAGPTGTARPTQPATKDWVPKNAPNFLL